MKVRFSPAADADLAAIQAFIAEDNPVAAAIFTRDLAGAAIAIGATPLGFPLLPDHRSSSLRRRVYHSYLIVYRLDTDTVEIVRVLHGARDYRSLLGGDE